MTYSDQRGRAQEPLRFPIDLAPLYGLAYVEEKGLHHVAKALVELQKTTKRWSTRGRLGGESIMRRGSAPRTAGTRPSWASDRAWAALARRRP